MRSLAAAARAAERDAQRRHKQALKERMWRESETAVIQWENYLDDVNSIHAERAKAINWIEQATVPAPVPPVRKTTHCDTAEAALNKFKPRLFDFLRGGSEKIHTVLEDKLKRAPSLDERDFQEATSRYEAEYAEWSSETELARRVIDGDVEATKEVLQEFQTLSGESLIGSSIRFTITKQFVHAMPHVHDQEIIPKFRRKQLASGRLSETKMPTGEFNERYQDYVASVALKVAGDLFSILPQDEAYVTCLVKMLNPQTGHQEMTPVLSAHFVRKTFDRLNLAGIDPSDALRNFNVSMNFRKTKGFAPINPLQPVN